MSTQRQASLLHVINKYGWYELRWYYAIRLWIFNVEKLTLGSKGNMWKVTLLWEGSHHIPLKLSYFILVTAHLWYFCTKDVAGCTAIVSFRECVGD